MAEFITGIQTADGVKQYDYEALGNKPEWKLLMDLEVTEEVNTIDTKVDSEGNSFVANEIIVFAKASKRTTLSGLRIGRVTVDGYWDYQTLHTYIQINSYGGTDRDKYYIMKLECDGTYRWLSGLYGNAYDSYTIFPSLGVSFDGASKGSKLNITRFGIFTNGKFLVGDQFKVYYR